MKHQRGFTLLELLVATTIMAVAVAGLLAALNTSIRNAGRLTNHDRAALVAKRRMEELLIQHRLPMMQVLEGPLTPATDAGLSGGWRAQVTPFESPSNLQPGVPVLNRVECEIWWDEGSTRKSFKLEGYRSEMVAAP
ncbi:MAG: prepilin-type N-terminal cleavage/methylation domain-containing protein [Bryobacteraceae bacterium]|nr:prepilin-type N-terminal cleavage/methylation domain-containing protein [Bryobacteraceae bacterium]